jgi:hypothetical protein
MTSKNCNLFSNGVCKDSLNCKNSYHNPCPKGVLCNNSICFLGHQVDYDCRTVIIKMSKSCNSHNFSEKCGFNIICNISRCDLYHDANYTNRTVINNMIMEFIKKNPNYAAENIEFIKKTMNYADETKIRQCRFHQICNNANCTFSHNVDYITRQKIIKIVENFKKTGYNTCKRNATCNNINCNLNHTVDVITRESIINLVNEYKIKNDMEPIKNIYDHEQIDITETIETIEIIETIDIIEPKFKDASTNTDIYIEAPCSGCCHANKNEVSFNVELDNVVVKGQSWNDM